MSENNQDLEMIQPEDGETDVYENDIDYYLNEFCETQKIDDMKKECQSVFNAALMYIKRHVFNDPHILKAKNNIYNTNAIMDSTYNSYNYDMVDRVCDYYIYMCMMYDKEVSNIGFSLLTGIDRDTIKAWRSEGTKLSRKSSAVAQKIYDYREESLSAKLATANKNPVGILAILNRHYQWNLPGVSREKTDRHVLSVSELPRLTDHVDAQLKLEKLED